MRNPLPFALVALAVASTAPAQEAGNASYGSARRRTTGVNLGNLSATDPKDSTQSSFLEANVLTNVPADEYLAVLALAQEAPTVAEAQAKLEAQVRELRTALSGLGVGEADVFVDFVTQNRVYDLAVAGNTARERLSGFTVKKNVSVRYADRALLDRMLAAAAKARIFDLVKVDSVLRDPSAIRQKLLEQATAVLKRKEESYSRLLGVRMRAHSVAAEKYNTFFPSEQYSSYVAYEAGSVAGGEELRVVEKRKTTTSYFNPLPAGEFDTILQPAGPEPQVQMTLYLKVKYTLLP